MKKRMIILMLCITMAVPRMAVTVHAQGAGELLESHISTAALLLSDIMEDSYRDARERLKKEILENGYDYEFTMNSFYEPGNPYSKVDFVEYISAYAAVKMYGRRKGAALNGGITNIDFLTMQIEPCEYTERQYVRIDDFEETQDGFFIKSGHRYINQDTEVDAYKESEDNPGLFVKDGKTVVSPEQETVLYGKVSLIPVGPEDLFRFFEIEPSEINGLYEQVKRRISGILSSEMLRQNVFIDLPNMIDAPVFSDLILNDLTERRVSVVNTALWLVGKVPYQWGGKASMPGYDTSWWTFTAEGIQKGLDCSGFVQWVYWTAGEDEGIFGRMCSTAAILEAGFKEVCKEELRAGDIGILNDGEATNHAGLYLGDGKWVHCSSAANTVTVSDFSFRHFFSPLDDGEDETLTNLVIKAKRGQVTAQKTGEGNGGDAMLQPGAAAGHVYAEDEIMLVAKTVCHEAGIEGLNGWIAVAEVIKNRIESDLFPNNVRDVIYQPLQFSKNGEIASMQPREELIEAVREVLEGRLALFGDADVLFFRNPRITDNIPAEAAVDWGSHKYYTAVGKHAFYTRR